MSVALGATSFFKTRPTSALPKPKGPVKSVAKCPNCFHEPDIEVEENHNTLGYDDLVLRKSLKFHRFSSVQFHPVQIYNLKKHMQQRETRTIYILATNLVKYESLLASVLAYAELGHFQLYLPSYRSKPHILKALEMEKPLLIPVYMLDCSPEEKWLSVKEEACYSMNDLAKLLGPLMDKHVDKPDFDVRLVPVSISKEVGRIAFWGCGSVCVQILQPYFIGSFLKNKDFDSDLPTMLAAHQTYDLHRNVVIFGTNLLAFILCYAEDRDLFLFQELVDYMEFFISIAPDLDMHLGFTGTAEATVMHALYLLCDWIERTKEGVVKVKNFEKLQHHAFLVTPKIANYAIIARSIIMGHNQQDTNPVISALEYNVKAPKCVVLDNAQDLSEILEQHIPLRRPCESMTDVIYNTMDKMIETAKYIKIEEPVMARNRRPCAWAGDYDFEFEVDSDEERDFAMSVFLKVCNNELIIDRLNMFINSLEPYLTEE